MRIVILGDATSINVCHWQQGLTEAGAEVHILTLHSESDTEARIHRLAVPPLPARLRYFAAVPAARRALAALKPDLVMGYFVTGYGTIAALSGFQPLVQVTSGDDVLIAPRNAIMRRLVCFNLSRADRIVCWAPHMAAAVESLGLPADRILMRPRGIPLDAYRAVFAPVPREQPSYRIISTRSLYPVYCIDLSIRAVSILRRHELDVVLTVVGDGPTRPMLEALAQELDLGDFVRFTGKVSNADLPRHLAEHDIYLSTIMTDGVSASLMEAMAAGLFPVVFDNAANRYWIEPGVNGLLIDAQTPETVATAVETALAEVGIRQYAWQTNRERAFAYFDLRENSRQYMAKFEALVRQGRTDGY